MVNQELEARIKELNKKIKEKMNELKAKNFDDVILKNELHSLLSEQIKLREQLVLSK